MRRIILLGLIACGLLGVGPIAHPGPASGQSNDARHEKATFAGGCFWCMEPPFDDLPGVISTTSGYTGGRTKNPTYEEVSSGRTGHAEAVEVVFAPTKITYARLLDVFWKNIDPLTPNQQFCDVGSQYRSAIYYHNEEQERLAEGSKKALESSGRFQQPIVTEIAAASHFYRAEEYHQDYYKKNPIRFNFYKYKCGRARRLEQLWGTSPSQPPGGAAAEHLNAGGASDMRVSAVHAGGTMSVNARLALRVTRTVAATVAASPRTKRIGWPADRGVSPDSRAATLLAAEPRYTYMMVPGSMPIHDASRYVRKGTAVRPNA